jgi:MarC family membrane protein
VGIVSAALVLFFVMDPLGNIPVFSSILSRVPPERRRAVLARELLIALGFLLLFLFAGRILLDLLSLKQEAIRVGGGIVLFLIALRLVFPPERGIVGETFEGEPFVFPLAVPLIAGPSAFATVLLLVESAPNQRIVWLIAVGCAWAASAIILSGASLLLRVVGRRGLLALERLTGMLLVMLAVQMALEGIQAFLALSGSSG